ncbi:MAG: lactate utilization protein [Clostridia bacterium]|nr:lactate utilization protein [Clostridia bacterium]
MDIKALKNNFQKRGFKVSVFENVPDAVDYFNNEIHNTTVGFGGSMTLKEIGLFDVLNKHNEIWWHGKGGQLKEYGGAAIMQNAMNTEIYVTSANAISEQGQIINIDGRGNRLASTLYGHKKVYFVVGKNKVAENFEKALWRARNIAAPKNAQRLGMKTPCAVKGDKCYDCSSPDRICRGFLTLELPPMGTEVEVVIINEDLGY